MGEWLGQEGWHKVGETDYRQSRNDVCPWVARRSVDGTPTIISILKYELSHRESYSDDDWRDRFNRLSWYTVRKIKMYKIEKLEV